MFNNRTEHLHLSASRGQNDIFAFTPGNAESAISAVWRQIHPAATDSNSLSSELLCQQVSTNTFQGRFNTSLQQLTRSDALFDSLDVKRLLPGWQPWLLPTLRQLLCCQLSYFKIWNSSRCVLAAGCDVQRLGSYSEVEKGGCSVVSPQSGVTLVSSLLSLVRFIRFCNVDFMTLFSSARWPDSLHFTLAIAASLRSWACNVSPPTPH